MELHRACDDLPSAECVGSPLANVQPFRAMSLSIHETFRVGASAERVFAFLTNPAEVVTCLPGAELTETIDERTYGGRVKVKVGPITAAYAGRATLVDVDAAEGRARIVGEGKES